MGLVDFNAFPKTDFRFGGEAGPKFGVLINEEHWILKYPKTTKEMTKVDTSYTTSPLSEYLGSKIYESIGIPVHDTLLGIRDNKVVVACKDFHKDPLERFFDFREIKNGYISAFEGGESNSGTGSSAILSDILEVIEHDDLLAKVEGVKKRFWDMFAADAFIGNNDRNNTNWGVIIGSDRGKPTYRLSPVFDNGAAFFTKRSIETFSSRMDNSKMVEDAFKTLVSFYTDDKKRHIHPFEYLKETKNDAALASLRGITEAIDMKEIDTILDEIPESRDDLIVFPDAQRRFYSKLLHTRLEHPEYGLIALSKRQRP